MNTCEWEGCVFITYILIFSLYCTLKYLRKLILVFLKSKQYLKKKIQPNKNHLNLNFKWFKFVNYKFSESSSLSTNKFIADIYLFVFLTFKNNRHVTKITIHVIKWPVSFIETHLWLLSMTSSSHDRAISVGCCLYLYKRTEFLISCHKVKFCCYGNELFSEFAEASSQVGTLLYCRCKLHFPWDS